MNPLRCMQFILSAGLLLTVLFGKPASAQVTADAAIKPNILWVTSEDNGTQLGCYGDLYADTPNIDALAASGMRYENCWSNAAVCAPARTTIISGLCPTSLGGQHMRSQVKLPRRPRRPKRLQRSRNRPTRHRQRLPPPKR